MLFVQYANPAYWPPLQHASGIVADTGWEVLFLGVGAFQADALDFPERPRITVKRLRFCAPGWGQKAHYLLFCLWTWVWALVWRPNWVYASDPKACPAARLLGLFGAKVLYHEHDSPVADGGTSWSMRLVLAARKKTIASARMCVLPNQERAELLRATERPREVMCVWNCPSKTEVMAAKAPKTDDPWVLYYHGNLGPHLVSLTLLEALAYLPRNVRLHVLGYETLGYVGYKHTLARKAAELGLDGSIRLFEPVPRQRLWEFLASADIGVSLLPRRTSDFNLEHLIGASNKSFDYLAGGLPLLVSDRPDWTEMFVEPGYARACNPEDPQDVAAAIQWFIEHPEETRAMGESGRQRILCDWNYENQFRPVVEKMAASS